MNTCSKCKISYEDDKKFCKKCGSPLTIDKASDPKFLARKMVFEDKIQADPLNIDLLFDYSKFLFENSILNESDIYSYKILNINDTFNNALELLFSSLTKQEKFQDAIEIGTKLLRLSTDKISLLINLGNLSRKINNQSLAYGFFNDAKNLDPNNVEAAVGIAVSLEKLERPDDAGIAWLNVYNLDSSNITAQFNVAIEAARNNEYEKTIQILEPLTSKLQDHHEQFLLYLYLSFSLCKLKIREEDIIFFYNKILDYYTKEIVNSDHKNILFEIINYLGYSALGKKDFTKAISFFENFDNLGFVDASKEGLGKTYFEMGLDEFGSGGYVNSLYYFEKCLSYLSNDNELRQKCEKLILNIITKRKKRKRRIIIFSSMILLCIVLVGLSVCFFNYYSEKISWDGAKQINTPESFQKYLNEYPSGRYINEATSLMEIVLYNEKDKNPNEFADLILKKGLIAYYPLFNNAQDSIGKQQDMILQNTPVPYEGTYCTGKYNGDVNFSTGTKELSSFDLKVFTISIQFKVINLSDQWVFVLGESHRLIGFKLTNSGIITLTMNNQDIEVPTSEKYFENTWQIATITYANDTAKIYLNEKLIGGYITKLNSQPEYISFHSRVTTTNYSCGVAFRGWVKNLRIYNRALNDLEIYTLCEESMRNSEINEEKLEPYHRPKIGL